MGEKRMSVSVKGTVIVLAALFTISHSFAAAADPEAGRLHIPASSTVDAPATTGLQRLGLGGLHGGLLYIPKGYQPSEALPLLVLLHRAEGTSANWFSGGHRETPGSYATRADAGRFIVLAPDAPGTTWGVGPRAFGNDVESINRALAAAFVRCAIDRNRIAIGGFSDGASYALSLGLANGDLIKSIVAFSPGFIVRAPGRGRPGIFISHGREDFILPIDTASRLFVRQLKKNGYSIDYHEFEGQHQVPAAISEQAMAWLKAQWQSAAKAIN
jgi:phospholipase/carboxylesterase